RAAVEGRFWVGSPEGTPARPNVDVGLDLGYHARSLVGHLLGSSVGLAPGYTLPGEAPQSWRVEVYMTTLSDRVRLAIGTNAVGSIPDSPWYTTLYFSVGVSDFPGAMYSGIKRIGFLLD